MGDQCKLEEVEVDRMVVVTQGEVVIQDSRDNREAIMMTSSITRSSSSSSSSQEGMRLHREEGEEVNRGVTEIVDMMMIGIVKERGEEEIETEIEIEMLQGLLRRWRPQSLR
jgi:hypothetical protein